MGNIMLDEFGEVKLTDFEYAKSMGDDTIPELRLVSLLHLYVEVLRTNG